MLGVLNPLAELFILSGKRPTEIGTAGSWNLRFDHLGHPTQLGVQWTYAQQDQATDTYRIELLAL